MEGSATSWWLVWIKKKSQEKLHLFYPASLRPEELSGDPGLGFWVLLRRNGRVFAEGSDPKHFSDTSKAAAPSKISRLNLNPRSCQRFLIPAEPQWLSFRAAWQRLCCFSKPLRAGEAAPQQNLHAGNARVAEGVLPSLPWAGIAQADTELSSWRGTQRVSRVVLYCVLASGSELNPAPKTSSRCRCFW